MRRSLATKRVGASSKRGSALTRLSRQLPSLECAKVVSKTEAGLTVDLTALGAGIRQAHCLTEPSSFEEGEEVLVGFLGGDATRPVVMGRLYSSAVPWREVQVNGKRVCMTAEDELTLECGEATIQLTKDGRVIVKGERVTTEARGSNRIRGGSVDIN